MSAARISLPWQLRLARAAVGYAALISAFLALGLPWRISAGTDEHATALLLVTVVVVTARYPGPLRDAPSKCELR